MEAYRLGNESDRLYNDSEQLRNSVENKNDDAKNLIKKAYAQQDKTDELLNDIHQVKEDADQAMNRWNKILNETESIYKDLKGELIVFTDLFNINKSLLFNKQTHQ